MSLIFQRKIQSVAPAQNHTVYVSFTTYTEESNTPTEDF